MPGKITLTVTAGSLKGSRFEFEDRSTVLIGKHADCQIRFGAEDGTVSRHHCLVDLNPPAARIRDLGSLNGTHVNGTKIGQRGTKDAPETARSQPSLEVDLNDGDVIKIGGATLTVTKQLAAACKTCGTEVASTEATSAAGSYCRACRDAMDQRTVLPADPAAGLSAGMTGPMPTQDPAAVSGYPVGMASGSGASGSGSDRCSRCGRDTKLDLQLTPAPDGVCDACRADPGYIVREMTRAAARGEKGLVGLKGYQIEKELGRGGMGAVYLARHETAGRSVALKVMLPHVASNPRARDMFLREAENTRTLNHKNVVRLFDVGWWQGTFFFTLEYCHGGSVSDYLARKGKLLPPKVATELIIQALDGLEYAHHVPLPNVKLAEGTASMAVGLVHRDVKPQNLFLTKEGGRTVVKVGDYGLSKAFDLAGMSGLSATGVVAGTPFFMPRQQLINFKFSKPPVDVWAAAASLYFLITGQSARLFPPRGDPWKVILETSAVPIRERNPSVPAKLAAVIDRALIDNPDIVISSAAELRDELRGAL